MTDHEMSTRELAVEAEAALLAEEFHEGQIRVDYEAAGTVELPPRAEAEPMVMRGVRLPVSLDERVREAAMRAGVPFSTLIREWIELGLTETETDQQVSLAALRRAIAHAAQSGHAA